VNVPLFVSGENIQDDFDAFLDVADNEEAGRLLDIIQRSVHLPRIPNRLKVDDSIARIDVPVLEAIGQIPR
jgi:hypothetical protein